jgi:hypothetical protein
MSDHPTYPAKTGAAGAWVWISVAVAVIAVAGFVWTIVSAAH